MVITFDTGFSKKTYGEVLSYEVIDISISEALNIENYGYLEDQDKAEELIQYLVTILEDKETPDYQKSILAMNASAGKVGLFNVADQIYPSNDMLKNRSADKPDFKAVILEIKGKEAPIIILTSRAVSTYLDE